MHRLNDWTWIRMVWLNDTYTNQNDSVLLYSYESVNLVHKKRNKLFVHESYSVSIFVCHANNLSFLYESVNVVHTNRLNDSYMNLNDSVLLYWYESVNLVHINRLTDLNINRTTGLSYLTQTICHIHINQRVYVYVRVFSPQVWPFQRIC